MQVINNPTVKMYQLNDDAFNVVVNNKNTFVDYLDAEYVFEITKQYVTNNIPLFKYQQIINDFIACDINQYLLT